MVDLGVWNIIKQISSCEERREILDWYHLMENLHKVGGSNQRLRQGRNFGVGKSGYEKEKAIANNENYF